MLQELQTFANGICGYAPQGSTGKTGNDGYSLYYSPFYSDNSGMSNMIEAIKNNKVFSTNPNYKSTEHVDYKIGDMIITADSQVLIINGSIDNVTLLNIGQIKIISNTGDGEDIFNCEVKANIDNNIHISDNIYNYIGDNCKSTLYHHRDVKDGHIYGNSITIQTTGSVSFNNIINKMDGAFCKLVINFYSGLRYEKILTQANCSNGIFIDNRYFYPYGYASNSSIWESAGIIQSYSNEQGADLKENLKTESGKCICDAYLEYYYNKKQYRKKIVIE